MSLWCEDSYSLLQLYTGDTLAPHRRRLALGAEPMTCPPNALQTGEGIVRLEPGETSPAAGAWRSARRVLAALAQEALQVAGDACRPRGAARARRSASVAGDLLEALDERLHVGVALDRQR